jgi:hypothetical protein
MMLTIPVVLYGLFRYLYVARAGTVGGTPEEMLVRDRPLLLAVLVWVALVLAILYADAFQVGHAIREWYEHR